MHMFSVFVFVCNSLMMKFTEKISNWNKIMNEQTGQTQPPPHSPHYHYQQPVHSVAVVHNTAHCFFHTVTRSHTQGTVCWQSAGQFCKLEFFWNSVKIYQKQEIWGQLKAGDVLVMWQTFGPHVVSFTKDSRRLVTLLTQVADQHQWCSDYKSLLAASSILITSCCLVPVAMKGLTKSSLNKTCPLQTMHKPIRKSMPMK